MNLRKSIGVVLFLMLSGMVSAQIEVSSSNDDKVYPELTEEQAKDFQKITLGMCSCINELTSELSDEMIAIIEETVDSGGDLNTAIALYAEANSVQAAKDGEILMNIPGDSIVACFTSFEDDKFLKKFKDDEIQHYLIETVKKEKTCKLTYAFMIAGQ